MDVSTWFTTPVIGDLAPEQAIIKLREIRESTGYIDVFHFIGHGNFKEEEQQGYLVFADDKQSSKLVAAKQFRSSLHPTTKLVVLNACETARGDALNSHSNIAYSLMNNGLPAVVAMQFKILDSASHRFARTFYSRLAREDAIDEAVAEARYAIYNTAEEQDRLDWAAPLLYVSSSDILSFKLSGKEPKTTVVLPDKVPELTGGDENPDPPSPSPGPDNPQNGGANRPPKGIKTGKLLQRWKPLPLRGKIGVVLGAVLLFVLIGGSVIAAMNFKEIGGLDLSPYCIRSLHY